MIRPALRLAAALLGLSLAAGPALAERILTSAGVLRDTPTGELPPCLLRPPVPGATEPPCVPAKLDTGTPAGARIARLLQRAEGFVVAGALNGAEDAIDEALRIDATHAEALHMSARLLLTRHRRPEARQRIAAALALDPANPDFWVTSAAIHTAPPQALADLGRALELRPDHVPALLARIDVHTFARDPAAAGADLDRLARIAPAHRRVAKARLDDAIAEGRFEDAIRELSRRLAASPHDMTLRVRRAALSQAVGDHGGAVADYDALLGTSFDSPRHAVAGPMEGALYFSRATSLAALGRRDEAGRDIRLALSRADLRLTLRIQLYLRRQGYRDVAIDGEVSDGLTEAALSCLANPACGKGLVTRT